MTAMAPMAHRIRHGSWRGDGNAVKGVESIFAYVDQGEGGCIRDTLYQFLVWLFA